MARHSLVPALDDLSHADAETGGLMTVEAGVERGVLAPHHAVVVHGDGVAATHDRAVCPRVSSTTLRPFGASGVGNSITGVVPNSAVT